MEKKNTSVKVPINNEATRRILRPQTTTKIAEKKAISTGVQNGLIISSIKPSQLVSSNNQSGSSIVQRIVTKEPLQKPSILSNANASLNSIFYFQLGEKSINNIMGFLSARDLIKYASLSRECRKQLPLFLQIKQTIVTFMSSLIAKKKWTEKDRQLWRIEELFKIQADYQNLLHLSLSDIEKEIQEKLCDSPTSQYSGFKYNSTRQDIIDILTIGMSAASGSYKQSSKIVSYIKQVGVRKAFKGIEGDHVSSYPLKINLPRLQCEDLTPLIEFLNIIERFINYTKSCFQNIAVQKDTYKTMKRLTNKENQQKLREKLLQIYNKPILRMSPNQSIMNYINQNILSVIISFLSTTEIARLIQTNKGIGSMVKQVILEKIPLAKLNREAALAKSKMSPQLAKAHLYMKQLQRYFNDREEDKIRLNPKIKIKLMDIIWNNTNLNDFSYPLKPEGDEKDYFSLGKGICPKFPRRPDVLSILQMYPNVQAIRDNLFEKGEKEQFIEKNYEYVTTRDLMVQKKLLDCKEHSIYKEVMLMYQFLVGIEMLRNIPKSEQPVDFDVNDQVYEEHLLKHDTIIHCYEKLIKTNKDELLLLSKKPMQFEEKYEPMYFGN